MYRLVAVLARMRKDPALNSSGSTYGSWGLVNLCGGRLHFHTIAALHARRSFYVEDSLENRRLFSVFSTQTPLQRLERLLDG